MCMFLMEYGLVTPISEGQDTGFAAGNSMNPVNDVGWHRYNCTIGGGCCFTCVQVQKDVGDLVFPNAAELDYPKSSFHCDYVVTVFVCLDLFHIKMSS